MDGDGDDFSRAARLGRAVAEGIISVAVDEAPLDGFATAQSIDHLIEASGGVSCLPSTASRALRKGDGS